MFSKDSRLADNDELEFQSRFGPLQVKTSFKLKDMKYRGKLEM
jgi:hypothetical protein